ncbi:unnamed protein product [Adineta ricciae]|uniref:T4 RNA ligase 1-like N-terminal domain-containing protein n=1 Tax=Adineta ricciae TaxID=249248 RepID=A0A815AQB3_ADIRI|nr:unnamed protein product [Adineta ricciae]CAF1260413.1 unnamed protein product [Adineta ricciae]
MELNMQTLYDDLMKLCSVDDTFYYKDVRLQSVSYRIFNYRLCTYAAFQSRPAALNCRGTMFNITNPKRIQLVSLPLEKFFNYNEGFGRQQFHQRGRFGDKMEKMDGTLISTFLHRTTANQISVRLKSKQSLISKQATEAAELLTGQFQAEVEYLARQNYTVNIEYTSPTNHVVVSYPEAKLSILSIRSHETGESYYGTRLRTFFLENNFPTMLNHIVSFHSVPTHVSQQDLLDSIAQESYGEGYVVEIIHPNCSPYLVKIKTQKYLGLHRDGANANSDRSLFEAIIQEEVDDLRGLYQHDPETLQKIDAMEQHVRPIYNHMIELIEQFYQKYKHLPKNTYKKIISQTCNMEIYSPLLLRLHDGADNDYKGFAMKHAKDLFGIGNNDETTRT